MASQVQLFGVACANPPASTNLERTVVEGVRETEYEPFTDIPDKDPAPIWGIRTGGWEKYGDKLEVGDIFLFYTGDHPETGESVYRYMATVADIDEDNPELADNIWEAEDGSAGDEWPYIIFLTDVTEVHIESRKLHDDLGWELEYLMDFRRVTPADVERLSEEDGSLRAYLDRLTTSTEKLRYGDRNREAGTTRADREERAQDLRRPKKTTYQVSRTIRNTGMVKQLKKEYDYHCQVCGESRQYRENQSYAEGHHLHPLGDSPPGPDDQSNILILCPNHHADFDHGMIKIDPDTLKIEHAYEEIENDTLDTISSHNPGTEYLEYNNENINF